MSPPGQRRGPPGETGRAEVRAAAKPLELTVDSTPEDQQTDARHGAAHHHVRGCFVLVVETPIGKYRRRCFLTLSSAQRAVERAEAAGREATIVLCRLEPVAGWSA